MNIDIKKTNWNQVSIREYEDIMKIITNQDLSDAEKDIALIALMAGVDENDIWDLPVDDVRLLRIKLAFVNTELNYPKNIKMDKLKIGDMNCSILKDVSDMTYGQYVDFETYIKEPEKYRAELFSVFVYPEGHKYNDGYDIGEYIALIRENVSITLFSSVLFFFAQRFLNSTVNTLHSLELTLRMKAWMKRGKEKELLRKMAKELKKERETILMYG